MQQLQRLPPCCSCEWLHFHKEKPAAPDSLTMCCQEEMQTQGPWVLQESLDDGMFEREHGMSYKSFCKLFDLLGNGLHPAPRNKRDDVILPKTKLMMTIRFLAGASYFDILQIHGVSQPAVFKHVTKLVMRLIADNEHVGAVAEWPKTREACVEFAFQWAGKSGTKHVQALSMEF
jgi:hypothetical protein